MDLHKHITIYKHVIQIVKEFNTMKKLTSQQQEVARKLKPLVEQILNENTDEITNSFKLTMFKLDITNLKRDIIYYIDEFLNLQKTEKKISKNHIIKLINYLEKISN